MRILLAIVALSLVGACTNESVDVREKDLNGSWDVIEARRNGKLTRTFSNAFFHFKKDGEMETNYTGELISGPFSLSDNLIDHSVSDNSTSYEITEWADSSFTMNFELQDFKFEFLLKRNEE